MFGGELVQAVLKIGGRGTGEPFKGPEEMGLVVVIIVNISF
jgi:hypothetical protein